MDLTTRAEAVRALPAFEVVFRQHFPGVARAAALVARDVGTGQELAQEAFFRLFERWSRMESEEHARRSAYRVAINLARSHLRKHVRLLLSGLDPAAGRAARSTAAPDEWTDVRTALAAISPRQRAAVVLVDYVGMDAETVGEVLGISPGTVRVHLMRGRRSLRVALGMSDGPGEPGASEGAEGR